MHPQILIQVGTTAHHVASLLSRLGLTTMYAARVGTDYDTWSSLHWRWTRR